MQADTERILNGEEPLPASSSKNYIGELPDKFTEWVDRNSERIENAKSLPYFLADNQGLINGTTANAGGGRGNGGGGGNTVATGGGGGNGNGSNGGGYNGGNVQLDDDEIRRRVHKAFADIGETIDDKDIKIEDGYVCLTKEQVEKLHAGQAFTRSEFETIKSHYTATGESFHLLERMRFDKNNLYYPIPATTSLETATDRIKPFTPQMIETAKALDAVISKNKLDFPVRVIRMVGIEQVENMAGINRSHVTSSFKNNISEAYNEFNLIGKRTFTEGGYMSVSLNPNANVMGNRPVMLVIDLPVGTNIYITQNFPESEGILERGRQLLPSRLEIGNIQWNKKPKDVLKIYCRPI